MSTPSVAELGRIFWGKHRDDMMFTRGKWHRYADGVWSPIHNLVMSRVIWEFLDGQAGLEKDPWKVNLYKLTGTRAYVQAKAHVPEAEVDAMPGLINLRNGVFDIDRGVLLPHSPEMRITTQLPFDYDPDADRNLWGMFLQSTFVQPGTTQCDRGLVGFVQEAIGYSLTTDISHHVSFWCIGEGANGKGVLFHMLECLGGDAAMVLNVALLSVQREHYQLARLAGKRIAMCSETASTRNLVDDATVKALVSGDTIGVRLPYQEPTELHPKAKLWWSMNHFPAVADASEGFWRRVCVIPFNRTFSSTERILDLKERLEAEMPGIFIWAVEGLVRLRDRGHFTPPPQVAAMTRQFRMESNPVELFVREQCVTDDPQATTQSSVIYQAYKTWCFDNTFKPLSSPRFKRQMGRLGFSYGRNRRARFFRGVAMVVGLP